MSVGELQMDSKKVDYAAEVVKDVSLDFDTFISL